MTDLHTTTATTIRSKLLSGTLSVSDYATALLSRATTNQPSLRAWAHLNRSDIMSQAAHLDSLPASQRGPLFGLPVGIKDIFLTKDMPTRFNSPIFSPPHPTIPLDATSVSVLRASGALIFGKTETTQFASTTTGGPCRNPHNPAHTPGGSSSGSAAAVADFHVPLALGTQTGGSIIRPASFCGIWGLKPTFGTASTEGMSRYSPSCDTVGYLARSVEDLDLLARVFEQRDHAARDLHEPLPQTARVGMLKTHVWAEKAGPGLKSAWEEAKRLLTQAGYAPQEVQLPEEFASMTPYHANLMAHESRSMFLGYYLSPDTRPQLDSVITSILERGLTLTTQEIRETYDGVARLRPQWDEFAREWDMVITPSTTDSAPEGLEWTGDACFNAMWTALHAPCVGVPGLKGTGDLPIGLTVVGARWADERVLRGAATLGEVLKGVS